MQRPWCADVLWQRVHHLHRQPVTSSDYASGGAVYNSGTLEFTGNGDITFSGNSATSSGGAVCNYGALTFTGNGDITFSGNSATSSGGAIDNSGVLSIADNKSVLFEKNYVKGSSGYRLQSIYSTGRMWLSAPGGGVITIADSVYSQGGTSFNAYVDSNGTWKQTAGDIVFTGKNTETHLAEILGGTPTAVQIQASGTSTFKSLVVMNTGRLIVQDNATLDMEGGLYMVPTTAGSVLVLDQGSISGDVRLSGTSALELTRINSITGNLVLKDGAALRFNVDGSSSGASLTLTGDLVQAGSLYLSVSAQNLAAGERYTLLSVSGAFDAANWTSDRLMLNGVSMDNLLWEDNTLYMVGCAGALNGVLRDTPALPAARLWCDTIVGISQVVQDCLMVNISDRQGSGITVYSGDTVILANNAEILYHNNSGVANAGTLEFTGNGDIIFSGNSAHIDGGVVYNTSAGTLEFTGNGDITFSGNSAAASDSSSYGGAICNYGTLTFTRNGDITFSGNSAYCGGGVVCNDYESTLTFMGNGDISFSGNSASRSGGAVYCYHGTLEFTGDGDITFSGNSASYHGGAVCNDYESALTFMGNGDVTFSGNSASESGAVCNYGTLEFTGNGDITFSGNSASYYGGAVYNTSAGTLEFTGNGDIIFSDNSASSNHGLGSSCGGAVCNSVAMKFTCNEDISFTGNSAAASDSSSYGGAICNYGTLTFTRNGDITFTGNSASSVSPSYTSYSSYGGAVYNGSFSTLTFADNPNVLFEKNYEKKGDSYRMRSIYSSGGTMYLSAPEGGCITFKDSIYSSGECFFNAYMDENDELVASYGEIVFTGESTAGDLAEIMGSTPTEEQITTSLTSELTKAATLYGGTLTIRRQAILKGTGLTVQTAQSAGITRVSLNNGTLSMSSITFQSGTCLQLAGANTMIGTLTLDDGAGLAFDLSSDTESPLLTLTGSLVQTGALTITVKGGKEKRYVLLAGDISFDSRYWDSDHVTVMGASLEDFIWQGDTLVINRTFSPFDDVILDGGDKEIGEGETITPDHIEIGGDSDSSITGGGSIAGGGDLDKDGTGSLTIDTENPDWTGDVNIGGGTVIAGNGTALGTGDVNLNGGSLDMGGNSIGNNINVNTDATINGGANYQGGLTLNDGTLSGGAINLGQDATLNNGTINNRLTGTGGVNKNGSGTVTLNGDNTFSGDVNIVGGTIVAGTGTALGTGTVSLNGGNLDMGGYALGNTITVNANATIKGGAKYAGNLTLTKGTISGDKINLASGRTATLRSGSVKSVLTGSGKVVKDTTGTVYVYGANTYTGGTTVKAGALVAKNVKAFGTGGITLTGGTLHMGSYALTNAVNVNATSAVINCASAYRGNLTLTKGTLSGQNINLYTGKTATLKAGTVKNVLAGTGKVVKDTTGTVYLYGANTYKGGTTLKAGSLSAKNVKALGTGAVTMTGGSLYLNSLAVANNITVNGTSATIKGGAKYRGNLTLTKGTLTGQNINLYTGKTATLKAGTVKNVLAGSGKVVKDTSGTSYLFGTNTYKGGTTVKAGSLSAKNVRAFGTGAVTMTGGSLYLNSLAVANNINVNATSATLKGGSKHKGKLTLTKGTLSGDKINIVSGKNAYLKTGTVKNALGGNGHVYKQGTGTVTLAGTNNWTGNTYVLGGTLVLSGATTLRGTTRTYSGTKLDVRRAVTMGNLYLGGGTLALKAGNMLTVTGTLTLANATKLALSGVTASSPVLIKYGKLSNTSKKSLNQFFGLTSAYTVTNKGGKLTIAKAGGKKGSTELEPQDDFIEVIAAPETYTATPNTLGQATWGTARAARLFDHTVRDHAQAQSVALDKNRSVWFAGMSGFSHVDDAADINIYGGVVGMQFNGSMGGNAGIAIGQTYGHVSPAGATRVKQQTQHAALYGTKMLYTSASDSVSLTGTASYGTTDSDHETLDWTQHSTVLGVRGTWEHKVGKSTAVYGFAGLEYLATDSESGSGSIQALQGSIGAGISHTTGRLTLHADASFTPDMVRNAPSDTVNPGRLGFEIGAGATYRLNDQWSINAGYTYHNEKRADSHEAYIGARCTF